nr:MAG TPA: hypothetical protein [Caudoviricetes sp.]
MTYKEISEALRVCGRGECDGCLMPEQACGALCTEAASALENLTELARENDKREDEAEENAANLKHNLACKQTENNILRGELRRMFQLYVAAEMRANSGVSEGVDDEP